MIAWRFLARLAAVYVVVVVLMVLAISPYFSAGWDPQIFAGAGRAVLNHAGAFNLYEVSRQVWGDWGYPYPPLYAHLLAPFIGLSLAVSVLPDWFLVRAVPVMFDVALALFVYLLVKRAAAGNPARERLARLGAVLWLFNPLTLYQTAIQGHQESSWLLCTVAAYAVITIQTRSGTSQPTQRTKGLGGWLAANAALPSLLMALAVTFKQSAILFYIPYVVYLLFQQERRWSRLFVAGALFAVVFGGLSLPYLLHSPDFFYLVYVDVSNMPVQTQTAFVWLLGLSRYLIDQTNSTFFLIKYQSFITMGLTALASVLFLRKDKDLFRLGLLTVLIFFLTSKKVMGYHYPMLVPFLLIVGLPRRRFDLVAISILVASWIVLSPYFAPWAQPEHLALYAAIATPNTLFWLWLFVHVWLKREALRLGSLNLTERMADGGAAVLSIMVITVGMILSSLVQPWSGGAPFVQAILLISVLVGSLLLAVPVARCLWDGNVRLHAGHVVLALVLVPLYFSAFALTAETTRIIEAWIG